jgi:hypothetical protein
VRVVMEKLTIEIMLVVMISATGISIIFEVNYVYAQWIIPSDLSGINQNIHHGISADTAVHNNNQTTGIINKR